MKAVRIGRYGAIRESGVESRGRALLALSTLTAIALSLFAADTLLGYILDSLAVVAGALAVRMPSIDSGLSGADPSRRAHTLPAEGLSGVFNLN